jgi:hypothetical protein
MQLCLLQSLTYNAEQKTSVPCQNQRVQMNKR